MTASSFFSIPRYHPDTPIRLRGAMKLATKYEIDSVRKRIIEIMEDSWPTTYERWAVFSAGMTRIRQLAWWNPTYPDHVCRVLIPEPAAAISFAQEFDIPTILPFAYYTLACISIYAEWKEDSDIGCWSTDRPGAPCAARWGLVDRTGMRMVMEGRENICQRFHSLLPENATLWSSLRNPERYGNCTTCVVQKIPGLVNKWRQEYFACDVTCSDGFADILHRLEQLSQAAMKCDACPSCQGRMFEIIKTPQAELWARLPGFFGLKMT